MENNLTVSISPHVKHKDTTRSIMLDVIIALLPALAVSIYVFGMRSIMVVLTSVVTCVLSEYIFRKIAKRTNTISDLSAVVTGIILAFNLPVTMPLWMVAIGGFVAIFLIKQLFGGIGDNFINPAIGARIVLFVSFATAMTTWAAPFFYRSADIVTSATPLALLLEQGAALPTYKELFLGTVGGCLGETSAAALLLGGVYLVFKKVISPVIPVCFIGTVFLFTFALGKDPVYQILSGGLMLGAIFMATDYTTSPMTIKGQVIFGISCGFITTVIRVFGSYPEGVSFAIILMNILTPLIDRYCLTHPFGALKPVKAAKEGGSK